MKIKKIALILPLLVLASCGKEEAKTNEKVDQGVDEHSYDYSQGYIKGFNDGLNQKDDDGSYVDGYKDGYDAAKEEAEVSGGVTYSIHTDLQNQYLSGDYKVAPEEANGTSELSKPKHVTFTVPDSPFYNKSDASTFTLRLSKDSEMKEYEEFSSATGDFTFKNLNINTKYYYYYWTTANSQNYYSEINSFYVKDEAPRNLDIEGVTNVRDLGGWKIDGTKDHTVQNLIYRTARLHDGYGINVTTQGKADFAKLGIKTEIDLRYSGDGEMSLASPLPDVRYERCEMDYNKSLFNDANNKVSVKKCMKIFADSTNYPIVFHCAIGTDRTGFIAFLLNALAGVSYENLCRDYMFSNFGNIGKSRSYTVISGYKSQMLENYNGGKDLVKGTENYLKDIGLTNEEVQTIKSILKTGI